MPYKLGRLAPHPETTHPRVKVGAHMTGRIDVPPTIAYYSEVKSFPMLLNDRLGDCTAAGFWHDVQAWRAAVNDLTFMPTNTNALHLYEKTGHYRPGHPNTDRGANEQDVLAYMTRRGVDGHKIDAFASVDVTKQTEILTSLYAFGGLYIGIQCPQSMQDQFSEGMQNGTMPVIDYVPGSPIEGGHCIVILGWDGTNYLAVTWGAVVKVTPAFWEHYTEEAWAIVSFDFLNAKGLDPAGIDLKGLVAEFAEIGLSAYPADMPEAPSLSFIEKLLSFLLSLFHK